MKPRSGASRGSLEAQPAERLRTSETGDANDPHWALGWPGWLALCAGWLIPQLVLLGPALVGQTVDLPVDLLAAHNV
jgi:hypothetical protein